MIPFFVTIPHSGLQIPLEADWLKGTPDSILNCDVDFYVDELYAPALKKFKIPFFFFPWHRYAVDVNRFSEDISHLTVENTKVSNLESPSDVHWHHTTKGDILIQQKLSQELHQKLIQKYFDPFHQKILDQFEDFKNQAKEQVYLLDLHSMPSQGLDFHKDSGHKRVDIVLGTNKKKSSQQDFIDLVLDAYKRSGFKVGIDWPYKGGSITQLYGDYSKGQNVIQVEVNRSLYMDETTKERTKQFLSIQEKLTEAFSFIIETVS